MVIPDCGYDVNKLRSHAYSVNIHKRLSGVIAANVTFIVLDQNTPLRVNMQVQPEALPLSAFNMAPITAILPSVERD